jgi:hypothetical protein
MAYSSFCEIFSTAPPNGQRREAFSGCQRRGARARRARPEARLATVLPVVPVRPKHIDDYAQAAGPEAVERVRRAAEPLRGARLLQVSSTAFGGLEDPLNVLGRLP